MGKMVAKGNVAVLIENRRPAADGSDRTLLVIDVSRTDCALRSGGIALGMADARSLLAALGELLAPATIGEEAAGLAPRCNARMLDSDMPGCELDPGHAGAHRGGGVRWS